MVGKQTHSRIAYRVYLFLAVAIAALSTAGRDGQPAACFVFNTVLAIIYLVYHITIKKVDRRTFYFYMVASTITTIVVSTTAFIAWLDGMGGMMVFIAPFLCMVSIGLNTIYIYLSGKME